MILTGDGKKETATLGKKETAPATRSRSRGEGERIFVDKIKHIQLLKSVAALKRMPNSVVHEF